MSRQPIHKEIARQIYMKSINGTYHMRFLSILFLSIIFMPGHLFSDETEPISRSVRHPIRLYLQKDYYRAISEILRLEFSYPDQKQIEELRPYLAKSYYHLGELDAALRIAEETRRGKGRFSDSIREEMVSLETIVLLEQEKDKAAKELWDRERLGEPDPTFPLKNQIPNRIDPDRARLYSTLLPGSGLLLSEEYGKATVSFLLNGLFVAGCYRYARKKAGEWRGFCFFSKLAGIRAGSMPPKRRPAISTTGWPRSIETDGSSGISDMFARTNYSPARHSRLQRHSLEDILAAGHGIRKAIAIKKSVPSTTPTFAPNAGSSFSLFAPCRRALADALIASGDVKRASSTVLGKWPVITPATNSK